MIPAFLIHTPGFGAPLFRQAGEAGLAEFGDASHTYDWGLFLSICKARGLLMIRVDATKSFDVLVKQSHLPVMVLSPTVLPECCGFPRFHPF
jgi:hypothetical protein